MNFTNDSVNLRGGASGEGQQSDQPIRFAGSVLGAKRHICAFFHNRDEEYQVLLPFIKEGLKRGEKAFHIVDPQLREEHLKRLRSAGIDVAAEEQSRHLELRNWVETYLREGHFDQDGMLALAQEVIEGGSQQGFALTRVVAHMEWALGDQPGVDDLLEYETRLNYILPQYKDPVICTYDLARFGGNIVVDIMRTHPMIIIGGVVQENPFFVPPDEFLRELAQRDATQDA
jgi:MEDS: MEthanogen/methylotroph, DcmR Sensory domain